ncbi:response regulator transcription factor [Arthrobacter sp. H14]|uniref:response regulator transcription factor n=1 Tax=Arthrobacter sp. H14 TaxID=1312959 RepID=UPI00047CBB8B|nr:response regulator transcription factor [Arthrobacter sp. H14]
MSGQGTAVVIEDDEDVLHLVEMLLKQSGFEVHSGLTGSEGVELVRIESPAVVTLDVGLPDIDGYEVLRRIREFSDCYVIMLTARADEPDMLMALQSGADDYLTKPFRPRELRARIGAMLRRPRAREGKPADVISPSLEPYPVASDSQVSTLSHNGLVLHEDTRTAKLFDAEIRLTRSEYDLLVELMRGGGSVRTKADLVRAVRGEQYSNGGYVSEVDERAVEVHVGNLRRKLDENPRDPRWLLTVRGVGYRMAPPRSL